MRSKWSGDDAGAVAARRDGAHPFFAFGHGNGDDDCDKNMNLIGIYFMVARHRKVWV